MKVDAIKCTDILFPQNTYWFTRYPDERWVLTCNGMRNSWGNIFIDGGATEVEVLMNRLKHGNTKAARELLRDYLPKMKSGPHAGRYRHEPEIV